MNFTIELNITVDEDANFLESDRKTNLSVIEELISDALYDIDDVKLNWIEVEQDGL